VIGVKVASQLERDDTGIVKTLGGFATCAQGLVWAACTCRPHMRTNGRTHPGTELQVPVPLFLLSAENSRTWTGRQSASAAVPPSKHSNDAAVAAMAARLCKRSVRVLAAAV